MAKRGAEIAQWAENQRALARSLGITIDDWMRALDAAGARRTGVYAASVGAAMARKLSLSVLEGFDSVALASRARALIDPKPPRVSSPLLAEAIRRADELGAAPRSGASRLKKKSLAAAAAERAEEMPTPVRETKPLGEWKSAEEATPDAPGGAAKAKRSRRKKSEDEQE